MCFLAGAIPLWALGTQEPAVDPQVREITMFTNGTSLVSVETEVEGPGILEFPVRQDELLDILKTLVVRDLDGGRILSAGFPASEPLQRSLSRLALDLSGNPGMEEMLRRAAGQEVSVHTRMGKVRGEILSVEAGGLETAGPAQPEGTVLNLNSSAGIRRVQLSSITRLEFQSAAIQNDLEQAARQLRSSSDNREKILRIAHEGEGTRRIRLTYLRPSPRWKSSYRLLVDNSVSPDKEARLEGWSIIENTGSRDWNGIQLNLSTANPVSFVMDLYSPRYINRPELSLPDEPTAKLPNEAEMKQEMFAAAPAMRDSMAIENRSAAESFSGSSVEAGARAADRGSLGTLVEYGISEPVSVLSGSSAMVPIISELLEVHSHLSYSGGGNQSVYRAVNFTLPESLQLVGGPLAIYDGSAFAGEALLPYIAGGSSHVVEYAVEPSLKISEERRIDDEIVSNVLISGGLIRSEVVQRRTLDYLIHNTAGIAKALRIRHRVNGGWTLESGTLIRDGGEENLEPAPREEASSYEFRLEPDHISGNSLTTLKVTEEKVLSREYTLDSARQEVFVRLLSSSALSAQQRQVMNRLLEIRSGIDSLSDEALLLQNRRQRIYNEQQRISRNMENLDRESAIYQRYLRDLNEQENSLDEIRGNLDRIDGEIQEKRNELEDFIANLQI